MNTRAQRFQSFLQEHSLDGFLITKPENVFWITDFLGSFGFVLVTPKDVFLITDARYAQKAETLAKKTGISFLLFDSFFFETFGQKFSGVFGFEDSLSSVQKNKFQTWFPRISFSLFSGKIEALRQQKTKKEIQCIQKAQNHVDRVLIPFLKSTLKTGISEKKLAFLLEFALRDFGKFELAFSPIVAFGENSSIPHHQPNNRKLQEGDNILIDCGVSYEGYQSDMTRNFGWKWLSDSYKNQYSMLLSLQNKILKEYICGKETQILQEKTKKLLGERASFFVHSLGHGIGLETHEAPFFGPKAKDVLVKNNVVTCEPGIYFPHEFGIRIEDLILITKKGPLVLSQTTKELVLFSA